MILHICQHVVKTRIAPQPTLDQTLFLIRCNLPAAAALSLRLAVEQWTIAQAAAAGRITRRRYFEILKALSKRKAITPNQRTKLKRIYEETSSVIHGKPCSQEKLLRMHREAERILELEQNPDKD